MHLRNSVTGAGLTYLRQAQQTCAIAHLPQFPLMFFNEVFHQWRDSSYLPLDVEIIIDVRLGEAQFVGRYQHLAQGSWMLEHQRTEHRFCQFRFPGAAIPQSYSNIADWRRTQHVL